MFGESDEEFLNPQITEFSSTGIPDITSWTHECDFMGCSFNRINSNKDLYCNEWKVSYCPSIYVIILITSSLFVYFLILRTFLSYTSVILDAIMLISNICFLVSYFATIFEGPGFLPFYYPLQITKRDDGVPDYLSGVVSNEQQENYVKSKPKMSRVGFFRTVHRYVLRPDHFCGWTGQFIGKKNYKLFVLFNIWGAIYTSQFLGYCIFALVRNLSLPQPFIPSLLLTLIYMLQCVLFCLMTWNFGCIGIYNIHMNSTQLEQMQDNKNSYTKPNCIDNWEEVCGPRTKWYFWIFPVPAFHDKSPEYLLTHPI